MHPTRYDAPRRTQHHFCGNLPQNTEPQSSFEKALDKPTLRDMLQNKELVLSKSVEVMRDKEKLRECHRLEESTTKYNADPWIGPWNRKRTLQGKRGKTEVRFVVT